MTAVCVFCGVGPGHGDDYLEAARGLGRLLAERNLTLIYGGGSRGLAGALANAALRAGGRVVGVMPRQHWDAEAGHRGLSDLFLVGSDQERLAKMIDLADGFLTLPGGVETLEQVFTLWRWRQTGRHAKPMAILDVKGLWSGLTTVLEGLVRESFVKPAERAMLRVSSDAGSLLEVLAAGLAVH